MSAASGHFSFPAAASASLFCVYVVSILATVCSKWNTRIFLVIFATNLDCSAQKVHSVDSPAGAAAPSSLIVAAKAAAASIVVLTRKECDVVGIATKLCHVGFNPL